MVGGVGAAISTIASQLGNATSGVAGAAQNAGGSFADVFKSAVQGVDTLQDSADQQVSNLVQGAADADLGKTMVSVEKADVAFQLMMQVRNKVVGAYQEMEKMQF